MKSLKPVWKYLVVITAILLNWLSFPFLTWNAQSTADKILCAVPLIFFLAEFIFLLGYKRRQYLRSIFINPVLILFVYNVIKPTINFLFKKPTKMKCCYSLNDVLPYDSKQSVYMEYINDDCDWEGLYYYTIDVNNFVTDGLIGVFGNPILRNKK